jgi:hypothetical protein
MCTDIIGQYKNNQTNPQKEIILDFCSSPDNWGLFEMAPVSQLKNSFRSAKNDSNIWGEIHQIDIRYC